jgi:hypothetical protein
MLHHATLSLHAHTVEHEENTVPEVDINGRNAVVRGELHDSALDLKQMSKNIRYQPSAFYAYNFRKLALYAASDLR